MVSYLLLFEFWKRYLFKFELIWITYSALSMLNILNLSLIALRNFLPFIIEFQVNLVLNFMIVNSAILVFTHFILTLQVDLYNSFLDSFLLFSNLLMITHIRLSLFMLFWIWIITRCLQTVLIIAIMDALRSIQNPIRIPWVV